MTDSVWKIGTVSVTNGSATVMGSGTGWAIALVTGGMFSCAGLSVPIEAVASDASLTLAYPWPGASASGQAYAIARETSEAVRAVWINDRLGKLMTTPWGIGVAPEGRGPLAARDALNPMPTEKYCWLREEPGFDPELYFKTPSGWIGPYPLTGLKGDKGDPGIQGAAGDGFNPAGAWVIDATYAKNDVVTFGGRSFVSFADGNVGHEPPSADVDDTYWQFVPTAVGPKGNKGDKGEPGGKGDKGDKGEPGQDGTGTGDVVGPASSVDGQVALFNGATGKLLKTGAALGPAATRNTGTASGNVPVLDGSGLLDEAVLPALAITDTFEVASQAAMLALTAQRGDIAVHSDLNKSFILKTAPASTLANWVELRTPTDTVLSVAALTGAISAAALKTALNVKNMAERNVTISTADPSGGADGDVWLKYTP